MNTRPVNLSSCGFGWTDAKRGGELGAFFPLLGGETMRNFGAPDAKSRVFDPIFATQYEHGYTVNLLCRHGDIAIAYKTRGKSSAMSPSFLATSTSPRKFLQIVTEPKTTKNGFSGSCAMRSQNDKCCRVARVAEGHAGAAGVCGGIRGDGIQAFLWLSYPSPGIVLSSRQRLPTLFVPADVSRLVACDVTLSCACIPRARGGWPRHFPVGCGPAWPRRAAAIGGN